MNILLESHFSPLTPEVEIPAAGKGLGVSQMSPGGSVDAEPAAGSPGQGIWGLRLPGHSWSWWGKPWEHKGPSPKGAQAGSGR